MAALNDNTEQIYKGFGFPIRKTSRGYMHMAQGTAVIKADLIQLLLTEPGERVMRPRWGTGLRQYLHEQLDDTTLDDVRDTIIRAIAQYEPRIVVQELEVTAGSELDGESNVINIRITFALASNLQQLDTLSLSISGRDQ